ncbi:MAG: thioredoxin [Lachnospiraceae bacterium]|nr:thioredoxin [Lachnospiraceae bacterium]
MALLHITKQNFEEEVKKSDKPVLIDFWAAWCGPCQMMGPVMEALAEKHTDLKVGKVNVDEEPELAAEFGVMSIPTFILMKDGKEVKKTMGAMPLNEIEQFFGI